MRWRWPCAHVVALNGSCVRARAQVLLICGPVGQVIFGEACEYPDARSESFNALACRLHVSRIYASCTYDDIVCSGADRTNRKNTLFELNLRLCKTYRNHY
jgi:hypothetical protein